MATYPTHTSSFQDYTTAKMTNGKTNVLKNLRKSLIDRDMPRSMELGLRLEQSGHLKPALLTIGKTLIENKFPVGIQYFKYTHEWMKKAKEKGQSTLPNRKDLIDLITVVVQMESNQLPLELAYMTLQTESYCYGDHDGLRELLLHSLTWKQPRDRCNMVHDTIRLSVNTVFRRVLEQDNKRQLLGMESYLLNNCNKELAFTYIYCLHQKEFMKDNILGTNKTPPTCLSTHYLSFTNPNLTLFAYDKRRIHDAQGLRRFYNFRFTKDTPSSKKKLMQLFEHHVVSRLELGSISLHYACGFRSCLLQDVRQHWRRKNSPPSKESIERAFDSKLQSLTLNGKQWMCTVASGNSYTIDLPVAKKSPSKSSLMTTIKKKPNARQYGVNTPGINILRADNNDYLVHQIVPGQPLSHEELMAASPFEILKLLCYRYIHKLSTRRKNIFSWRGKLWSMHENKSKSKREHFRDFEWSQLLICSNRRQPVTELFEQLEAYMAPRPAEFYDWVKTCRCSKLNHLVGRMDTFLNRQPAHAEI